MKRSNDRILTTHVGSLPRPSDLVEMLKQDFAGQNVGSDLDRRIDQAIDEVVRKQAEVGIDVISDGEMGKIGFIPYVNQRLTGFEPSTWAAGQNYWGDSREARAFPDYYAWAAKIAGTAGNVGETRWINTGPIRYKGHEAAKSDIQRFKRALAKVNVQEAFMPAISPGNVADWEKNQYYKSDEEYLFAIADAMNEEYRIIIDSGLLLQVDDPILATYYVLNPDKSVEDVRRWAHTRIEALNHALRGLPRERIRYHTCYSINMGPRLHDMEGKDILDLVLKVNAGAYSFEAANPRHEHEWRLWEKLKLPEDSIIIPGVITHSTNLIEHEELVADRLLRFASLVGRDRVMAGADCGFASFAANLEVHDSIVWAKFRSLVKGADLASKKLWGK